MKTCSQCQSVFPKDYVFCLNDGTLLHDAETEQETVLRPIANFGKTSMLSPDMIVACVSCQVSNRANSKFCKKCGTVLTKENSPSGQSFPRFTPSHATPADASGFGIDPENNASGMYEETVAFQPQRFTPPGHGTQTISRSSRSSNPTAIQIAILAAVVIGGGAFVYSLQKVDGSVSSASNSTSPKSVNSAVANAINVAANAAANSTYNSAMVGRTGRLTTNQRIRSASNRYSEILGVHYRGARVRILGVESHNHNNTVDGYSTWYRVHVIENGCDQEGIRGCGNDLNEMPGQAAMEGWMNAKYISLD